MGDELVGEDGGVGFDLHKVDGHSRDFSEDGAAEGVGEGEVNVRKREVDMVGRGLTTGTLATRDGTHEGAVYHLSDSHARTNVLAVHAHGIVIHDGD